MKWEEGAKAGQSLMTNDHTAPRSPPGLLSNHKLMEAGDFVGEGDRCILDRIIAAIPLLWRGARQGGVVLWP